MKTPFENCLALVKVHEGFKAKPYLCPAGKPTIGYGTTYYAKGIPVMIGDPEISEPFAEEILREHLADFWESVDELTQKKLNGPQLSALTSLAYNIGLNAFKVSTILKKVNNNPTDPSIYEEFLRWNRAGSITLRGLTLRRIEEAKLYFSE